MFRLVIFVLLTVLSTANQASDNSGAQYLKLLEYEYNNRAFALISAKRAANKLAGTERGEFYQSYHELEIINQRIYTKMQEPLGFDHSPGCFTRFRGHAAGLLNSWIEIKPDSLIDIIEPYIAKLQSLHDLASKEHRGFFGYVVAQEQAQLDASRAAKANGYKAGTKVFRDFIEQALVAENTLTPEVSDDR